MLGILLCLLAVTPAALPKTRARSDVFTQLFRSIRKVPLHAGSVPACNGTFRMERKSTASDSACNGTFICYHVTDNPPIKWQGSAWVLYNIDYSEIYTIGLWEYIHIVLQETRKKNSLGPLFNIRTELYIHSFKSHSLTNLVHIL